MGNSLEYDEEEYDDLFDDDGTDVLGFVDDRKPVVKEQNPIARARSSSPGPSSPGPSTWPTVDQRLAELHRARRTAAPPPTKGVNTLHSYTMFVIRSNSSRIWNIGGLEYGQIAELIDELPREQLEEIEEGSPHILKDTDWLWEKFILQEFPLFHERCRERQGERRASGWRRMFASFADRQKAQKDSEERKAHAVSRVAERYAEMDAKRASKKIVVLSEFVAPPKGRKSHSLSTARRGHRATQPYSAPNKVQTAIAKARVDAQRARVALTHSSGMYIPPPVAKPARPSMDDSRMYHNPFIGQSSASTSASSSRMPTPTPGPRLPPPRSARTTTFKDAYPTNQSSTHRAALPVHLENSTPPAMSSEFSRSSTPQSRLKAIRKPEVDNFVPAKPVTKRMDFFGEADRDPKRVRTEVRVSKVRKEGSSIGESHEPKSPALASPATSGPSATTSEPISRPSVPNSPLPRPQPRKPVDASVLFVKKKKPPVRR